jgi:hypothetical protein
MESDNLASVARQLAKSLATSSEWNIVQEIAQEVTAHFIAAEQKPPIAIELLELVKNEIRLRYADQPETMQLLLTVVPTSKQSVSRWQNLKDWDEAVWQKLKLDGLFTAQKRAEVINALYKRGIERDTQAAKIYLTLSGDYSERMDIKSNEIADRFLEINRILHGQKEL